MIEIKETHHCDIKNPETITEYGVKMDTMNHIQAVVLCGDFIADSIKTQFAQHDCTKLGKYLPMFYRALKTNFKDDEAEKVNWWKIHSESERHHLNDYCPKDVNLIDVLEMICDCVCAGKARTGSVYPIAISDEVLQKALANTQRLLEGEIGVRKTIFEGLEAVGSPSKEEAHAPTEEEWKDLGKESQKE